jgi:hypothetical protein
MGNYLVYLFDLLNFSRACFLFNFLHLYGNLRPFTLYTCTLLAPSFLFALHYFCGLCGSVRMKIGSYINHSVFEFTPGDECPAIADQTWLEVEMGLYSGLHIRKGNNLVGATPRRGKTCKRRQFQDGTSLRQLELQLVRACWRPARQRPRRLWW